MSWYKLALIKGNVDKKNRFAGRQAGRQARLTGAGMEELKRAGEQEAEQNGAGGFCRRADKDISISSNSPAD